LLEKEKLALEKEQTAIAKATITKDPNTAYRPPSRNDLVGTTWRVISIENDTFIYVTPTYRVTGEKVK